MAKKKAIEKKKATKTDAVQSDVALMEKRVEQLEYRVNRIVAAISKSKSTKGL